jgi:hypothetical protein
VSYSWCGVSFGLRRQKFSGLEKKPGFVSIQKFWIVSVEMAFYFHVGVSLT